jgi:hypothetical protein
MPSKPKSREPRPAKTAGPSHTNERIRIRAYEFYEQRGRVDGFDLDDWLRAEAEVLGAHRKPKPQSKAARPSK